jgi:hypothetical protein
MWILIAIETQQDDEGTGTWIGKNSFSGLSNEDTYLVAIYFCITTITTVGYGDISASNPSERIFCILLQITGASGFSYAISIFSSIV